ncbi:MAG: GNAT family N-acetyltransferase, partial [Methyloligellaceae bacterium]
GIATEAIQTVIDHAFREAALPRLLGRCRVGNGASRRVLEKCGFQFFAAGMIHSRALNGPVATEDFVLERSIWKSLKRWGHRRAPFAR